MRYYVEPSGSLRNQREQDKQAAGWGGSSSNMSIIRVAGKLGAGIRHYIPMAIACRPGLAMPLSQPSSGGLYTRPLRRA